MARKIIQSAEKNIYIVVSLGNHLFEFKKDIEACVDRGVKLHILIHDEEQAIKHKKYIGSEDAEKNMR